MSVMIVYNVYCIQMLDVIADHFGNRDVDFSQRMQLAYEKVFFDMFHRDLMAMYSVSVTPPPQLMCTHLYCAGF